MFIRKQIASIALAGLIGLSGIGMASSYSPLTFYYGNETVAFSEEPEIVDNTVYLPLSEVSTRLGIKVSWVSPNVVVQTQNGEVVLPLNALTYTRDGKPYHMSSPLYVKNQRTMVPLRLLSELSGHEVRYEGTTKKVTIERTTKDIPYVAPSYLSLKYTPSTDGVWAFGDDFKGGGYVKQLETETYQRVSTQYVTSVGFEFMAGAKLAFTENASSGQRQLVLYDLLARKRIKIISGVYTYRYDAMTDTLMFIKQKGNQETAYAYAPLTGHESVIDSVLFYEMPYYTYAKDRMYGAYQEDEIALYAVKKGSMSPKCVSDNAQQYFWGLGGTLYYVPFTENDVKMLRAYDVNKGTHTDVFSFNAENNGYQCLKADGSVYYQRFDEKTGKFVEISKEAFLGK